jgi:preprotein translocase subunit YajC
MHEYRIQLFLAGIVLIQSVFIFVLLRQRWLANKAVKALIASIKGEK